MNPFKNFQTLADLLGRQREALEAGDAQRLTSLHVLLDKYAGQIASSSLDAQQLTLQERQELKFMIEAVQDQVRANQELWEEHRRQLQESQSQLRAARRLIQQMRPQGKSSRFQKKG